MVYLRFEDWSNSLHLLDKQIFPDAKGVIKIYASEADPREKFNKNTLFVVEANDEPFGEERFELGERGTYSGHDLEKALSEKTASDFTKRSARALLRFVTDENMGFGYAGLLRKIEDDYVFPHPLDAIDGWSKADRMRSGEEGSLHIDVVSEHAFERLGKLFDINDPALIRTSEERAIYTKEYRAIRKESL